MAKRNTQASETCCSTDCSSLSPAGSCRLEAASGRASIRFPPGTSAPQQRTPVLPGLGFSTKGAREYSLLSFKHCLG